MRSAALSCRLLMMAATLIIEIRPCAAQIPASEGAGSTAVSPPAAPAAAVDPLTRGLAMLADGRHAEAAEVLTDLVADEQHTQNRTPAQIERSIRAMIGAGQSLRHLGRYEAALEFFEAAIGQNPAHAPLDSLRLAAADCAFRCQAWERACQHSEAVLDSAREPSLRLSAERLWIRSQVERGLVAEAWQRLEEVSGSQKAEPSVWADLALAIGLQAVARRETETATVACQWYLEHAAAEAPRETAVLGVAWAAAQGAESYQAAAERLLDFVEQFPESTHVPRALSVAAGCLERAAEPEQATSVLLRLVGEHPASEEAAAALGQLARIAPDRKLPPAAVELARRLIDAGGGVPDQAIVAALLESAGGADPDLWQSATEALLRTPSSRAKVWQVLSSLSGNQQHADAERLAAVILGGQPEGDFEPAFEQTCRWAAVHRRWSMLALAAESPEVLARIERLSPLSLRLLAEGLVQVGRGEQSRTLLDRLIEVHEVSDFDVLVRRAEIALVHDTQQQARESVRQAAEAAAAPAEQTVADLLQSQMLIREARMDEARVVLEAVVRRNGAADELKARAQWLIGETHFLQRRYSEAVEAYRVVETFDRSGDWTAAALVQAGKSFEQLGRPRDAAICYSGLLRRFGDCPHAAAARDRLAAIGGTTELR